MNKRSGHIFLNYATEDRSRVASLATLLEIEGGLSDLVRLDAPLTRRSVIPVCG